MKSQIPFLIILLLTTTILYGQNAKKFLKTGETFAESKSYQDAIENFTKALELEPNNADAFAARAKAYVNITELNKALLDYERASILDPKSEEYTLKLTEISYTLNQYESSVKYADKTLLLDKKSLPAFHYKVMSLHAMSRFDEALETANKALEVKKNYQAYFDKATVLYASQKYVDAQNYYQLAIGMDPKNIEGYLGLANTYFYQNLFDQTIMSANSAMGIDQRSMQAYWIRALAYHKKMDYINAINDLSQIIVLYPNDPFLKDVFFKRGGIYYDFKQHTSAINDFTSVMSLDPQYYPAYFNRAASYEEIQNFDKAIADYEKLKTLGLTDAAAVKMIADAEVRLFELKRENAKPVIVIDAPVINASKKMQIIKGKEVQEIVGRVDDQSPIKSFSINGVDVKFDSTSRINEFVANINVAEATEIKIVAKDVYDNVRADVYPIERTEINAPIIALISPVPSDDGQIYLEANTNSLFIEGAITDESKIASVQIDSVNASYIPSTLNPAFAATVSIANKTKITVEVIDIYGNKSIKEFLLNREGAAIATENPMGKTWVVFIENSEYSTFASLSGPTKDITMMKSALSNYNINNVIHKRNMTKNQMEKFFSIELRDLVIKNRVSSIIVWYAGHGKFINSTGYWIPVDGKTDDEFTYFNITALKASMNSYSSVITHTLVITDACESGPSFYQAMRSDIIERDCADWKATKFKSSQVFSSAGYELASDNSQFTKTFANSLIHNPNSCIPIESIVKSVKSAVVKNNQQAPQFGKIDGLADENGTFFFIRK